MLVAFACFLCMALYAASCFMAPQGSNDVVPLVLRYLPVALVMVPVAGWLSFVQLAVMPPPPGQTRLGRALTFWIAISVIGDLLICFLYTLGGGIETPRNTTYVSAGFQDVMFWIGATIGMLAIAAFVIVGLVCFVINVTFGTELLARDMRDWWRQ